MNDAKRLLPFAFLFALCIATPTFAAGPGPMLPPSDGGGGVLAAAVFLGGPGPMPPGDGGGGVLAAAVFSGAASAIAFLRARGRKK